MTENNIEKTNHFKIALYRGDSLMCESIFDADCYNPHTRYSVDIRNYLFKVLRDLKSILSDKKLYHEYCGVDLLETYNNEVEKYPHFIKNELKFKTEKTTNFKFVLFINNNTVVEREFSVFNFNPNTIYSLDVFNYLNHIKYNIQEKLRAQDINLMWEDYDLINNFNYNIQQVRELPETKRKHLLFKIYSN